MKKIILTSASVLFIVLSAFAQEGGKCDKKCIKKCDQKECVKECVPKWGMGECASVKCDKESVNCRKDCKAGSVKEETKAVKAK